VWSSWASERMDGFAVHSLLGCERRSGYYYFIFASRARRAAHACRRTLRVD
jgi:hypothetical protein